MKKKAFLLSVIALVVAMIGYAVPAVTVDGRWTGTIENHFDVTIDIKQQNGKVSGTVTSELGDAPLTGGRLVGSDISFKELSYRGISLSYVKGKVNGDKMNVIVGFQGQEMKGTLKRLK